MRIAYLLSSLANSGPIVVAHDLAILMASHGHHVEIFYFDQVKELDFPKEVEIHKISFLTSFPFDSFDIVHCHGFRPDLYVLFHKPLFSKTAICSTIHSYMFSDHAFSYGKFMGRFSSRLVLAATCRDDKVILLSRHMLDYYSPYFPKRKMAYAYNSRNIELSNDLTADERKQVLDFKGADKLLVSVSALNLRKGLWQIINVLPFFEHVKYCVVGDGKEMDALKKLAEEKEVLDRVLFVGRKQSGYRYLKYADAFVMPSYSEGFPLAMLEAASMGKAILCSDIPVFEELFSDEEVSKFKLDDIESLKNALNNLLSSKDKYSRKAQQHFLTSYSPECFYKKHLEIYNLMLNSDRE